MIGEIKTGTRSHAVEIMIAGQNAAVHESFKPGRYFEFDGNKELFVDQDGLDVTKELFYSDKLHTGWHTLDEDDDGKIYSER